MEAGSRWENQNMTLDLQVKQLTQQLEDAKNTVVHQEDEKNYQQSQLQEIKDSVSSYYSKPEIWNFVM